MLVVLFILLLIVIVVGIYVDYYFEVTKNEGKKEEYYKSSYYVYTRNGFLNVMNSKRLMGEYESSCELKSYEALGGRFLYDVYLPDENGNVVKMDMLFITPKGIFIIDNKSYKGRIIGDEDGKKWIERTRIKKDRRFDNPLIENAKKVDNLKRLLSISLPVVSLLVFSDKCKFRNIPVASKDAFVLKRRFMKSVVRSVLNDSEQIISFKDVDNLQKELYSLSLDTEKNAIINNLPSVSDKSIKQDIIINKSIFTWWKDYRYNYQ